MCSVIDVTYWEYSFGFIHKNNLFGYSINNGIITPTRHGDSNENVYQTFKLKSLSDYNVDSNIFKKKNKSRNIYLNICNLISVNRKADPVFLVPILLLNENYTTLFDHVSYLKSSPDLKRSRFINKNKSKYVSRACPVRGEFSHDNLVISFPLSEIKKFQTYDIICSDIFKDYKLPLYVFNLSKGFIYRLYQKYVYPGLKYAIHRCTKVDWDQIKGEGIFKDLPTITSSDVEYDKNVDIISENIEDSNVNGKLDENITKLSNISITDHQFTILLSKYIKSIKDIVFVYKTIQLLRQILSRDPTKEELNYAFHGFSNDNDIWSQYIAHKKEVYRSFHRLLFKYSHKIAKTKWKSIQRRYYNQQFDDECIIKRINSDMFSMGLELAIPRVEHVIIDSLWHEFTNMTIRKLNEINGNILQFVSHNLNHTAYIHIYKSLGVDIQKVIQAKVANRLIDSFTFKRSMMGLDDKDSYTLYTELMEQVANKMGISVPNVVESIDYSNELIHNPEDPIPNSLRFSSDEAYRFYDGITTFSQLYPDTSHLEELINVRNDLFVKTMRLLALEAIPDRIGRYVFIGYNGLFISESKMTIPELAETLKMNEKVIEFIIYTCYIRCSIYESTRISKNLPPFYKLTDNLKDVDLSDIHGDIYYTNMKSSEAKEIRMKGIKEFIEMPIVSQIKYYRINRKKIVDILKKSPLASLLTNVESPESNDVELYPPCM